MDVDVPMVVYLRDPWVTKTANTTNRMLKKKPNTTLPGNTLMMTKEIVQLKILFQLKTDLYVCLIINPD